MKILYDVRVGKDWQGMVDAKSLLWENTEKER